MRRDDVQAQIELWARRFLADNGGTGKVTLDFDFHEWQAVQLAVSYRGRRLRLTDRPRRR